MKRILLNNKINREILNKIISLDYEPILLPDFNLLPKPVSSHPDMLCFKAGKDLITFESYYNHNKEIFDLINVNIITISDPKPEYPLDIALNALLLKNNLIIYNKNTNNELVHNLDIIYNFNLNIKGSKQGYVKCSSCIVDDNSIITSDKSIIECCNYLNIDYLQINPGYINLDGYDYGFIGGASFIDENKIYFFGNINNHVDNIEIKNYIKNKNRTIINLSNNNLIDYGGAIII